SGLLRLSYTTARGMTRQRSRTATSPTHLRRRGALSEDQEKTGKPPRFRGLDGGGDSLAEPVHLEGVPAKQAKISLEGLISRHHTTEKHASPAAAPSRSSFSERSRRGRRAAPAGP